MLRIGLGLWIAIGWAVLHILGWHIPSWFIYLLLIGIGGFYILNLIDNSIIILAKEIESTNARIEMLEQSVEEKLDEIASRLPKWD